MSDITTLAAKLKGLEQNHSGMFEISDDLICDVVDVLESAEKRIAEMDIESAVKDASILELKQQYQRLRQRVADFGELLLRLQKAKPGGVYFHKWDVQICNVLAGDELEARTLTVKLPPVMQINEPGVSFNAYGQSGVQNALYEACAADGIKLQIEE